MCGHSAPTEEVDSARISCKYSSFSLMFLILLRDYLIAYSRPSVLFLQQSTTPK